MLSVYWHDACSIEKNEGFNTKHGSKLLTFVDIYMYKTSAQDIKSNQMLQKFFSLSRCVVLRIGFQLRFSLLIKY